MSLLEKFTEVLNKQREERAERDRERIRLLTADPFDPEAQHLIAEEIRQENNLCYSSSLVVKVGNPNMIPTEYGMIKN